MKLFYGMSILHIGMEGIGGIVACIRPDAFEAIPVHAEVARNYPHNMRCIGVLLMIVAALGVLLVADAQASNAKLILAICSFFHLAAVWMIAAAPSGADMGGVITHGLVGVAFAYLAATHQPKAVAVAGSKENDFAMLTRPFCDDSQCALFIRVKLKLQYPFRATITLAPQASG
eukprot:CAMPEP_0119337990 /NCGR_PEP_ID=MMETSP1333-20130426/95136_1 /TAXON_ID=418940 /ORGANISM="Scyphosphaera apsteinii, Strain RCC1455" /LENGTH=173 /DNA_ID=CAMNT_0007349165 /DNA_START=43 /DNA_END=565 /DNA_ORIENTATION=-